MAGVKLSFGNELKAFRDFALKGNVVDLAFAVIIGAAFSKIVDSLVKDIIMPVIGLVGSADFSNYFLPLSHNVTATNLADAQKQGAVLAWGSFATYGQFPHRCLRAVPHHQGDPPLPVEQTGREAGPDSDPRGGSARRNPRSPRAIPHDPLEAPGL